MNRRVPAQAIEQWKSTLLTLPDDAFFDIMRNYLGELKTPFNKHSLVEELSSFLRNPETQARIIERIDESDARVLTAIHVLDRPDLDRLFTFFEGTMGYLELHYLLLNLQERLLLSIEGDGRTPRLLLNPFLAPLLRSEVLDSSLLFPSKGLEPSTAQMPWPSESLMLAFFSFLSVGPDVMKRDGRLKKRAAAEVAVLFPVLSGGRQNRNRAVLLLAALRHLDLVELDGGVATPVPERWSTFGRLDSPSRRALLWAALVRSLDRAEAGDESSENPATDVERDARVLSNFFANLENGVCYPRLSLERLLGVFGFSDRRRQPESTSRASGTVSALAELGLIVRAPDPGRSEADAEDEWFAVNPSVGAASEPEPRPVVVEPNFQLTVKPSLDFADGVLVASMAEIRRFDLYPRYEITKRSFVRALERGYSAATLIGLLETLGESPLSQNVRFSLESWEREFRGIALYRGIVLTADSERRHLIEHSEIMKPWIKETLAPGVYLLAQETAPEWSKALKRAGIDPLPAIRSPGRGEASAAGGFHALGEPRRLPATLPSAESNGSSGRRERGEDSVRGLLEELGRLELPPDVALDLTARINKKLILFPEQLARWQPKVEKNEAKGLDYIGKVRLVEQALRSGTELLEIIERTAKGGSRRLLVRPIEVRKSGNDLMLRAVTLPESETVQILVRKIGLVRKLKSSLYAP